jgi:hypothetical protein
MQQEANMKLFFVAVLIATLSMLAGGDSGAVPRLNAGNDAVCETLMNNGAPKEVLAQLACCQKNKGICGCRAGKIVCCDKSFSPTCTC